MFSLLVVFVDVSAYLLSSATVYSIASRCYAEYSLSIFAMFVVSFSLWKFLRIVFAQDLVLLYIFVGLTFLFCARRVCCYFSALFCFFAEYKFVYAYTEF